MLTGTRDTILNILSQHLRYKYNIQKSSSSIRGIIERERNRGKDGKEMAQEMPMTTREAIVKKYRKLKIQGQRTFEEDGRKYKSTAQGFLQYIKEVYGFERTGSWLY